MAKEKNPTIPSALPAFERMRQTWEQMQSDLPETEALIQPGLDKLAEYRHYADINPTYIIATILNPRLKLQWFEENVPHMTARAKMIVLAELKSYKTTGSAAGTKPNQTPGTSGPFIGSSSGASDEDPEDILGMHITVGPTVQNLESELDVYLQEAREPSEDLLRYWERKRLVYPTIFQLAMDILPIQASAVPCERAFSSSKVTMSARRNRITPGLMEALQVLKFSIKHGNRLDFTAHLAADKQWAELEEEMLVDLLTPEDITSFRESLA